MTTITQPATLPVSVGSSAGIDQRLVLNNVCWSDYIVLGKVFQDRPGLYVTFDRHRLEIMTTSILHEKLKRRLGRLVETLAEEFNLPVESGGNMTFQRQDLERGLEADDCFWMQHQPQIRGRTDWDPDRDPPPDLAVEIEITRSALDRMAIYAAIRVPEVWRYDGVSLVVHLLQADGTYRTATESPTFPGIPIGEIVRFIPLADTEDLLAMVRTFRAWVWEQLGKSEG